MDSLTQAVLGAAIGEAVLGKKAGTRAAVWGAVAGTLPDLDVLADPFLSDVEALVFHRGLSHAFLFAFVMAPMLGWLIKRIHHRQAPSWRNWSWLAFLALFTHPLLDCFTTYGTQLFLPFNTYPVAFNTLFIIDPLYTVPLALGLFLALRLGRTSGTRRLANYIGLGLSTLYLLVTVVNQRVASAVFAEALQAQGLSYERLATRPTPLNSLLWVAQAEDGDGYWVGLYSLLDADGPIHFRRLDKNVALLEGFADDPNVQRLLWFSRGFYSVKQVGDGLIFNDIRFGRSDSWLRDDGAYIFSFRLSRDPTDPTRLTQVEQLPISIQFDLATWKPFFARIGGR